jgi:hypothetical protein
MRGPPTYNRQDQWTSANPLSSVVQTPRMIGMPTAIHARRAVAQRQGAVADAVEIDLLAHLRRL